MSILSEIKNNTQWKAWAILNTTESRSSLLEAINNRNIETPIEDLISWKGIATYNPVLSGQIRKALENAIANTQDSEALRNSVLQVVPENMVPSLEEFESLHYNLKNSLDSYGGDGIVFSDPVFVTNIGTLISLGIFTSEIANKIIQVGIRKESVAMQKIGRNATEQEVEDWCTEILRESWQIRVANAYTNVSNIIADYSLEQLQTLSWDSVHDLFATEPE